MNSISFLAGEAPGFALKGSQVKILPDPSAFYNELCMRASSAKNRITLSALYLGTGKHEVQLVDTISRNLEQRKGQIRISVLLDYCRGNRMSREGASSCTLLRPLLKQERDSCRIALYHTPVLRGLWKALMPPKYNETLGLQHTKVYLFDDSLIISGANLSEDYFTNRQDRYVLIEDCPNLADFFDGLVSNISDISFQMDEKGDFALSSETAIHPYKGDYTQFVNEARHKFESFLCNETKSNQLTYQAESSRFIDPKASETNVDDTWIFPSIQMGLFQLQQDNRLTKKILRCGEAGSRFKFGTGYFNPTKDYLDIVLTQSKAYFDFLMAHPKANGFLGAKFPAGGIPFAYTLITNKFYHLIQSSEGSRNRIKLFEYQREGWTFHGKGLWHYFQGETLPSVTLIGSPNFGYRSVEKDLESQITIVTKNPELRTALHEEQDKLFKSSSLVSEDTFKEAERIVPNWVKFVVAAGRNFF